MKLYDRTKRRIKRKLNRALDEVSIATLIVILIFIPAIPGILLWYSLDPITFWQKFAIIALSIPLYILTLVIEIRIFAG